MKLILLIVSIFFSGAMAMADGTGVVGCEMGDIPRCPCSFAMDISCNGFNGHIDNNQRPEYLKVVVMDENGKEETYTLKNPPNGAIDYHGSSLGEDEWVLAEVNKQRKAGKGKFSRLSAISSIDLAQNGLGIKEGVKLYGDADGREPAGEVSADEKGGSEWSCWYINNPVVTAYKSDSDNSCRSKPLCVARAKCRREYVTFEATLSCVAKNDECPTATECAADKSVKSERPINKYRIKVGKPKKASTAK